MRLELLVEATNKLLRISRPTGMQLRDMLAVGCKELRILVSDPTFFTDIQGTAEGRRLIEPDVLATFSDLNRFAGFLEVEKKVLLEAGLEDEAVNELVRQATALRPSLGKHSNVDPDLLRIAMIKLSNEVCNLAELSEPAESQQFRNAVRPVLRRAALVLSGATVVTANIVSAIKLGPEYASASISVGTGMVKEGVSFG
jgi:hypothetical protein